MPITKTRSGSARDRIIETAERLFYAYGVRGVGIDRIIAEAGVAKMTLYNHFPSKDDLILAVLQHRESRVDAMFEASMKRHADGGLDPLECFFAALKDWFEDPAFRGCAFINASVELADSAHPASIFSSEHKKRFRRMVARIVSETRPTAPPSVAAAVSLLVEGAIATAVMEGGSAPADIARDAALALVAREEA